MSRFSRRVSRRLGSFVFPSFSLVALLTSPAAAVTVTELQVTLTSQGGSVAFNDDDNDGKITIAGQNFDGDEVRVVSLVVQGCTLGAYSGICLGTPSGVSFEALVANPQSNPRDSVRRSVQSDKRRVPANLRTIIEEQKEAIGTL